MNNENQKTIIDTMQELCEALSRKEVTVRQVGHMLGTISDESSMGLQLAVLPKDPAFTDIQVISESETSTAPSHVAIKISPESRLTLPALEAAFGPSAPVPRLPRATGRRVAFFVELPGQPYTCAIFAGLSPEEERVTQLTIRRDIRLEE